jgi:hypothetical protein
MFYSEKYKQSLSFKEVENLFLQYLSYCQNIHQIPEYTFEEFYLFKNKIPENFINYLIYQDKITS